MGDGIEGDNEKNGKPVSALRESHHLSQGQVYHAMARLWNLFRSPHKIVGSSDEPGSIGSLSSPRTPTSTATGLPRHVSTAHSRWACWTHSSRFAS
jgi:hypothetical protein